MLGAFLTKKSCFCLHLNGIPGIPAEAKCQIVEEIRSENACRQSAYLQAFAHSSIVGTVYVCHLQRCWAMEVLNRELLPWYLMETVKMTGTVSTGLDEIMILWLELGVVIKNCFKNPVIIMNIFFFFLKLIVEKYWPYYRTLWNSITNFCMWKTLGHRLTANAYVKKYREGCTSEV